MPPRRPSRPPGPPTSPPPAGPVGVESLGGEGDGLVRLPDGVLHVAGALPGETVRLRAGPDGPVLDEVVTPSPLRRTPPCPHFGACGGCALPYQSHGWIATLHL